MPTTKTEFGIAIRDATGNDGYFTGNLKLAGAMLAPEIRTIGRADGEALDAIWRDPSDRTAKRVADMIAEHGMPGLDIAVIEIRRA